jgi:uncharacterized protein involved in exopolysaccharide biosynthesis
MMPVDEQYSVGSHWLALKKSRKWILACTLTAALGAGLLSSLQPRIFGAKTFLLVSTSKTTEADEKLSNFIYYELLKTYETLIFNDSIIQKIIENFGLQKPPYKLSAETLRPKLDVSLLKNTRLLEIRVEFPDARLAAEIANFFARQAVNLNEEMNTRDRERAVLFFQKEMEQARQQLVSANNRLAEFSGASGIEKRRERIRSLLEQVSQDETRLSRLKVELSERLAKPARQTAEADAEALALKNEVELSQKDLLETTRKLDRLTQENAAKEGILDQLSTENSLARENYSAVGKKLQEASSRVSARTTDLQQASPALPSERSIKPRTPLNILLGAVFGLLASMLLSLVIQNHASPKRKTEERHGEERLRDIKRGSKGY